MGIIVVRLVAKLIEEIEKRATARTVMMLDRLIEKRDNQKLKERTGVNPCSCTL